MDFLKRAFAILAFVTLSLAYNTVTYISQDGLDRQVHFTAGPHHEAIASLNLTAHSSSVVDMPYGWQGMSWAVVDGATNRGFGVLAEFQLNSDFGGMSFFDVSAISGPLDADNIKMIVPKNSGWPVAGCQNYPGCDNCYNFSEDAQTKTTHETDFIVFVGNLATTTRSRVRDSPDPPP